MTNSEIEAEVLRAMEVMQIVDTLAEGWSLNVQTDKEHALMKTLLAKTDEESAKKSVMLAKLKETVGDETYDKVKNEVLNSADYKSITLHSNG